MTTKMRPVFILWTQILEVPSSVFTEVKEKLEQLNQAKSDKGKGVIIMKKIL